MSKYSTFFAAYNASVKEGNPFTKEEQIQIFTGGRTTSLKELSSAEVKELTKTINDALGIVLKAVNDKADRMRKSIIAIFKKMERTTQQAIAWAEKQGVKGEKKKFNDYTTQELFILIRIAEKVHADWLSSIRKQVSGSR